jgi:hypothetical protein
MNGPANASRGVMALLLDLEEKGRYTRGLRLVNSVLLTEKTSADLLASKARLLTCKGRLVDALSAADLAVYLWPDSTTAHAARAGAFSIVQPVWVSMRSEMANAANTTAR